MAAMMNGPLEAGASSQQKLAQMNEGMWYQIGTLAEKMNELDRALQAYESALRHNPYSIPALTGAAALCAAKEHYPKAVEFYQHVLNISADNGEVWGALGYCYLMVDDLQKAYTAYQQALYHLPNPKEPKLWYGVGILYDRYGSYGHAEEAFSAVIRMDPKFEKANEIYFRLGIIYKQREKYDLSLQCFQYILPCPPKPLTEIDLWFQIGHVYEQQKAYQRARDAYEKVLAENPNHAKVLQQLGWLYHQQSSNFSNQELAISFLTRSIEADQNDAQTWYLLGRCYMSQQKYNKAYDAYQQAVYRDGRNPTFWCSIGVLYYQINQSRDALDAYSRAIRLNPFISEVWYDLGTLYESCNNQVNDALDAYNRALELDPTNPHIKQRLQMLRSRIGNNGQAHHRPTPPDMTNNNSGGSLSTGPSTISSVTSTGPTPYYQGPAPPSQIDYANRHPLAEPNRMAPTNARDLNERLPMIHLSTYANGPMPAHHGIQSPYTGVKGEHQQSLPSIMNRSNCFIPGLGQDGSIAATTTSTRSSSAATSPTPYSSCANDSIPTANNYNSASHPIYNTHHEAARTPPLHANEPMSGVPLPASMRPLPANNLVYPHQQHPIPHDPVQRASLSRPSSAGTQQNGMPIPLASSLSEDERRRQAEAAHVAAAAALIDVASSQPRDNRCGWGAAADGKRSLSTSVSH